MNTTAVSPAAINAFLAELCGFSVNAFGYIDFGNGREGAPYTESLDALFVEGGPVDRCCIHAWLVGINWNAYLKKWEGTLLHMDDDDGVDATCRSDNPALALAAVIHFGLTTPPDHRFGHTFDI